MRIVYEELLHEKVVKLHANAHVLLFSSIWEESLPHAVIESMLMGTIPVATRVSACVQ
jgi:glycosyltransferase involved in cell wall biosynthesis